MKMTKLAAVAAGLIVAASLAFTSCDGLGKDDFFGTWEANYEVTSDNVAKGAGDGTQEDKSSLVGSTVDITMYFDGTSEKLANAAQKFYQYKIRKVDGVIKAHTFWVGSYELKDNANYTKGTLILTYRLGFDNVSEDQANALGQAWLCSTAADAYEAVKDVYTAVEEPSAEQDVIDFLSGIADYDYDAEEDVEKFDFELGGQDFIKGYTTMTATAKENCSWEVTSRSFNLKGTTSVLSEILNAIEGSDDTTGESE